MPDVHMRAYINPLAFLALDEPCSSWPLTCEAVLQYLCPEDVPWEPTRIAERYRELKEDQGRLVAAPAEPRILERLVWPLRHAKGSYMLGNPIGTIAMTGFVAEMIAMLIYEISEVSVGVRPADPKQQERLYGATFEKLGQERRVKVLQAYGLITEADARDFDAIRTIRRRYLHLWSEPHSDLPADARACYSAALGLVVRLLNPKIDAGRLIINPSLMGYLIKKGIAGEEHEATRPTEAAE